VLWLLVFSCFTPSLSNKVDFYLRIICCFTERLQL
jgi:hypothetical protein